VGGLPRQHLLGSGPELSQQVVMMIQTAPGTPRRNYYWRSLTYDRYTGQGWLTSRTETKAYSAGQPVLAPPSEVQPVRQQVQVVKDRSGLVHAAGLLVTVDRPYKVAWRPSADPFGATVGATTYQAESYLSVASEAQLRAAESVYPTWVQRRYLALPDKVPSRVLTLARNLTATEPTPYDRARAIEAYLRSFPYDLNIPPPPQNRDVVDYFLFDLQRGYCDYYATAMVVLARAAGLPARLVVGYASGAYDSANDRYLVTEADAHSWPELYFPGSGWIEFEPTASRPTVAWSADTAPILPPELAVPDPEAAPTLLISPSLWWGWGLAAGLAGLALAGLGWLLVDTWWLSRLSPTVTIEQLYRRLLRYGRRLAVPIWAGETPYEFNDLLVGRVVEQANRWRWGRWLKPAVQETHWLTDLYVRLVYSTHPPDLDNQTHAIQVWWRLRWRLWLAWARFKWASWKDSV
jgi:transglutaminase-like putative cysteine protease